MPIVEPILSTLLHPPLYGRFWEAIVPSMVSSFASEPSHSACWELWGFSWVHRRIYSSNRSQIFIIFIVTCSSWMLKSSSSWTHEFGWSRLVFLFFSRFHQPYFFIDHWFGCLLILVPYFHYSCIDGVTKWGVGKLY